MKTKLKFKKDKVYNPDSVADLPKECNKYFSDEEFQEWGKLEFEYGSVRCLQSFEITWNIKELPS